MWQTGRVSELAMRTVFCPWFKEADFRSCLARCSSITEAHLAVPRVRDGESPVRPTPADGLASARLRRGNIISDPVKRVLYGGGDDGSTCKNIEPLVSAGWIPLGFMGILERLRL